MCRTSIVSSGSQAAQASNVSAVTHELLFVTWQCNLGRNSMLGVIKPVQDRASRLLI